MRVIVYNNPVMTKYTHINGNASSTKATEATITNLNPAVTLERNDEYKIGVTLQNNDEYEIFTSGDYSNRYNIGRLYSYDAALKLIIINGDTYTKEYCDKLIATSPDYRDYENNPEGCRWLFRRRKLVLEFLKRFMAGEFKYCSPLQYEPMYYHEFEPQKQRDIKLFADTVKVTCKPIRPRKINH